MHDTSYWAEVETLFDALAELPPDARQRALTERCAGRPDLCQEVASLLAAADESGGFIEPAPAEADESGSGAPGAGSVVGAFLLGEMLGRGGMGVVHAATRADGAYDHRVAVKVLTRPVSDPGTSRRFRAERQILASLRHPGIVALLDGGVAASGHAYLVMERVDGEPIDTYCARRALPLAPRLRLFRDVCAAVHHAHRHGVVHRDLKPSNILVTADGAPKVLDFGIARLLDAPAAGDDTTVTQGHAPLTPNYASPEQLRGIDVTTSSDVYALGVLLYELLTGVRPYDTVGKPVDEVLRLVVDAPVRRPSAATPAASPPPYDVRRTLRGDLDAIVARAMAVAPEDRYTSAGELGDDLQRHLDGTPVVARPLTYAYVLRKLAARHTLTAGVAAIAAVLTMAALVVALWQARVATSERARAERRFDEIRQLANTLIFRIHDAVTPLPGSTPVRRQVVAEALRYLESLAAEATDDPDLQLELARAYVQIGKVQGLPSTANLGDADGAVASFTRALRLLSPLAHADAPAAEVVDAFVEAARRASETLAGRAGGRKEAVARAREAVAVAERFRSRQPADARGAGLLAAANFTTATAIGGTEALPYWRAAEALYEELLAASPGDPAAMRNVALVHKYLGGYYERERDLEAAIRHHARALELDERRLAAEPGNRGAQLDLAIDLGNVAYARWQMGDPAAAVPVYERSLALRTALAQSDPQNVLARSRMAFAHLQLARVHRDLGEYERGRDHARAAVRHYARDEAPIVRVRFEHAEALYALGQLERLAGAGSAACDAFSRAAKAFAGVPEADRRNFTPGGDDPLGGLRVAAARCR